jgi:hypothetical protein
VIALPGMILKLGAVARIISPSVGVIFDGAIHRRPAVGFDEGKADERR